MDWATIAQLVISEGIPVAESLWQKWSAGTAPTQADFDNLRTLVSQDATAQMTAVLSKHGIALDSPQGVALLALTK